MLPGWNSIETATRIQNWLWWTGWCFFALVLVFEVASHIYGNRRDDLIKSRDDRATEERQRKDAENEEKHREEIQSLESRATAATQSANAANERAEKLEELHQQRRLSEMQQALLGQAIEPFPGQKITVMSMAGDAESHIFSTYFVAIFRAHKWDCVDDGFIQYGNPPPGVLVVVNAAQQASNTLPAAAHALIKCLMGLEVGEQHVVDPRIDPGTIQLVVGVKPHDAAPSTSNITQP